MIIIPIGGIANRIRVISSVENLNCKNITYINIRSNALNANVDSYFNIETLPIVRVIDVNWNNDKVIRRFFLIITSVIWILSLGFLSAKYNVKKLNKKKWWICTCHEFNPSEASNWGKFLPEISGVIKKSKLKLNFELPQKYNSVHIRHGDNKRALKSFSLGEIENFIESSSLPVYIATDSSKLKGILSLKYKDKVIFILDEVERDSDKGALIAIAEMGICANSESFHPSKYSSFSKLVLQLKIIN
jgi:hypothetical protein